MAVVTRTISRCSDPARDTTSATAWRPFYWEGPALLVALGLVAALHLYFLRVWLDFVDEGYFIDLADRMLRGWLPYRDFSIPYTPGVFYLHQWSMELLGRDVASLRIPLLVAKLLLSLLMYVLARRMAPPHFAAMPVLLLLASDTIPVWWEPHPAWYALLFALGAVWCVCRLRESGHERWLVLAGLAAALSFAFKQNFGLLILAATAGFLLFHGDELPRPHRPFGLPRGLRRPVLLRAGQAVYALLLLGGLYGFLRQLLEPRLFVVFWLPVAGWLALATARSWRRPVDQALVEASIRRCVVLLATFLVPTAAWLAALSFALAPSPVPLALFLGGVDLGAFYWPLAEPRLGFFLLLLAAAAAPLAVNRLVTPGPFVLRLSESVGCLVIAAGACDLALADPVLAGPDVPVEEMGLFHLSVRAAKTVQLYLPSLAFWGGLLIAARRPRDWTLRWLLLAGALLLFNVYPRMDAMHVTMSAPLLWVVGAGALAVAGRYLTSGPLAASARPLVGALVFGLLLVLPAAAALPNVEWRVRALISKVGGELHYDVPGYVPLGLPGADVRVPWNTRDAVVQVVEYIQANTAPHERIFVYPTLPLFYYLTQRENATRFGHAYPGAATLEEQSEMMRQLGNGVRYIIWDAHWADGWERPELNRPLTNYIRQHYRDEVYLEPFWILKRVE